MIRLKNILKENIQKIDIAQIQSEIKNKKFIEIGFITEYPDTTIFYIKHEYSTTNNYILQNSNKLIDSYLKEINNQLKKNKLKAFSKQYSISEGEPIKVIAVIVQPLNYKVI